MKDNIKGLGLLNAAVFLFSFGPLFAKVINISPTHLILFRCIIAALMIGGYAKLKKIKVFCIKREDLLGLGVVGVFFALHWTSYFKAMQVSNITISTAVLFIYPVFTSIIEPIIIKESFDWKSLVLAFGAFLGVALMLPKFDLSNNITQGVLWSLLSAILMALRIIYTRKYIKKYHPLVVIQMHFLVSIMVLSPFISTFEFDMSLKAICYLLVFSVVITTFGQIFHNLSLSYLKASTVGIISSWQIITSPLLAVFLLGEVIGLKIALGAIVVFAIVCLEMLRKAKN
jgi:drug/metabolite transporter (DMT)-like permease